jgi:hypothetical protein
MRVGAALARLSKKKSGKVLPDKFSTWNPGNHQIQEERVPPAPSRDRQPQSEKDSRQSCEDCQSGGLTLAKLEQFLRTRRIPDPHPAVLARALLASCAGCLR